MQDAGWRAHYPTGNGLLAFHTMEEALTGIESIYADYPSHSAVARRLAEAIFDAQGAGGDVEQD